MKNVVLTAVFICTALFASAQDWLPEDYKTFNNLDEASIAISDEEWVYIADRKLYLYIVDDNAIGIKHAYTEIESILRKAGLELSDPDIDNSYLASYIENKFDYGSLNTSISVGGSEVEMIWDHEGYRIVFSLTEDIRGIFILKP
jgi:hypothetical protein